MPQTRTFWVGNGTLGFCIITEVSHRMYSSGASAAQCQGYFVCLNLQLAILRLRHWNYSNSSWYTIKIHVPTFIMLVFLLKAIRTIDKLVLSLIFLTVM